MTMRSATYYAYRTPHGPVTIRAFESGVTNVAFGDVPMEGERRPSELTNRAATELLEYFAGKRRDFDLPLAPEGSSFQLVVWEGMRGIPYGEALTASQLAHAIGRSGSHRATGAAVRRNPLAVLVPDHRVVGADGRPSGTGAAARLRGALLDFERRNQDTAS
ncbi:cysteine methyltransferase [Gordonibacter sp. An230]|uniref:methylated-DNA--[protein]-cysteine S-methyltransferase n=1 Tax=Gordonibacter sp. An230 TaxID=1965592 RepID=UPI000B3A5F48|nr:methylated-DNA--[protein]-cysteine S-methyltransferase [Gordonibacter sp. An230]OUO90695.1 cysteine methyltransferase [Gordonibacter sp. An230]